LTLTTRTTQFYTLTILCLEQSLGIIYTVTMFWKPISGKFWRLLSTQRKPPRSAPSVRSDLGRIFQGLILTQRTNKKDRENYDQVLVKGPFNRMPSVRNIERDSLWHQRGKGNQRRHKVWSRRAILSIDLKTLSHDKLIMFLISYKFVSLPIQAESPNSGLLYIRWMDSCHKPFKVSIFK
jgi:hypothetical protein